MKLITILMLSTTEKTAVIIKVFLKENEMIVHAILEKIRIVFLIMISFFSVSSHVSQRKHALTCFLMQF